MNSAHTFTHHHAMAKRIYGYVSVADITPSDTVPLQHDADAIYIGGDGDLEVVTPGGSTATLEGLKAGQIIPVQVRMVKVASTASGLVALYAPGE